MLPTSSLAQTMSPRMTTRSAGRKTIAPRGGRTGGRSGRGGGRSGETIGRVGGQTGDQDGQRGNHTSNIQGDVRNVNICNSQNGCSYKEFMACNLKDYDGKGGAIAYTRWIKKMESVQDMSGCGANHKEDFKVLMSKEFCPNNEMLKLKTKFLCHAIIEVGHAAYTDCFRELAKLVPHLVTFENKRIERYIYGLAAQIHAMVAATEPTTIQSVVLKDGMLTDKAIRNGSLKKNIEKRGNGRELSRNENARDDSKRSRTGRAFATITSDPVKKEYTGSAPKCTTCNYHHPPEKPCRMCTSCNCFGHFARDCRVGTRMVNPVNARNPTAARGACFKCGGTDHYKAACLRLIRAHEQRGNRPNQALAIDGGQGSRNNGNQEGEGHLCWEQRKLAKTQTS
ncbi:reverse transcriptase domain-containing protein [Tanacetum coccineum]